ncbi:MAG: nitroreductase family protein [Bryobacterales bacterium]
MAKNSAKHAEPDHPIQRPFMERWSPYVFSGKPVPEQDLRSLFEAARWSASSFNEQPWRYVVARQSDGAAFQRLLECLSEANQKWARHAPVLALGLIKKTFTRNGKPNRVAEHDLGAASAALTTEATVRGLHVHQMAGVDVAKAHEAIGAPEDFEVITALAIGYAGDEGEEAHLERDAKPRTRKPLADFVFGAEFGHKADWV